MKKLFLLSIFLLVAFIFVHECFLLAKSQASIASHDASELEQALNTALKK